MRVTFVGVGEAFDETLPNTSVFMAGLAGGKRIGLLLDCGFTAAAAYFSCPGLVEYDRKNGPDAVWISHFHGDHYFGLPYLLHRLLDAGRTAPLAIYGGAGVEEKVPAVLDLAYPALRRRLPFDLTFVAVEPDADFSLAGVPARAALTDHPVSCLGIRLKTEGGVLYYSGDGAPTEASLELADGAALIVHEAYGLTAGLAGHGSVPEVLELASQAWAKGLAVVHVNREVRREKAEAIRKMLAGAPFKAFLPEPGEVYTV